MGQLSSLTGRLLLCDLAAMSFQTVETERRPECEICGELF
jgi:hypothetical protein